MKGRPIDQLVYECMFPKPRQQDPQNFQSLLHRYLIPEVRQEVQSFYGHIDTQEAKYPGLDYCHPVHRIRLGRWPWHRRLFRAFDGLRLTCSEIKGVTKWEGTKWAKERFERDSGTVIRDTAGDDIPEWVEPEERDTVFRSVPDLQEVEDAIELSQEAEDDTEPLDEDMDCEEEDSDGELESVGFALNERLRERAARREAGDISLPVDEEWEQWLKNMIESGQLPFLTEHITRQSAETTPISEALLPPRMLDVARAGRWQEIPDCLHNMLRLALESETTGRGQFSSTPYSSVARSTAAATRELLEQSNNWRRTYSDLRLPVGDVNNNGAPEMGIPRTARPNA